MEGKPSKLSRASNASDLIGLILQKYITRVADSKATFTRDRIRSDQCVIRSIVVRIHGAYTGPVRNWNGTASYGIYVTSGPILVPDSRSDPYRIH